MSNVWVDQKGWAEARADVACNEAAAIVKQYRSFDKYGRYCVRSAYDRFSDDVEQQHGQKTTVGDDQKNKIASHLMNIAKEASAVRGSGIGPEGTRYGALGVALLSLLYEVETLPGDRAQEAKNLISGWHAAATAESDNSN